MKTVAYVGNDVHQETITVCVYVKDEIEPRIEKTIRNQRANVERLYRRLYREYEVRACYEASGNGYVFYRWLKEMDIHCDVIAPSLIPRRNGDRIKTDKRDARKLGRYYRSGELTTIHVPTAREEASRSLVRLREQLSRECRSSKQYILKFVQARGLVYRDGKNWTHKHRRYLKGLKFDFEYDQMVFNEYLLLLEFKETSLKKIDGQLYDLAHGERYCNQVEKLMMLKGIKEVTAMGIITEVVDFKRFVNARELMAFLGWSPVSEARENEDGKGGSLRRETAV